MAIFKMRFATSIEDAIACNCEHCDEAKVIGLGEETTTLAWQVEEDSDDDGNRTICARDRDFNDRTFPSVCHMLCYNHCTRYRMVAVEKTDVKKYISIAYRPSEYRVNTTTRRVVVCVFDIRVCV